MRHPIPLLPRTEVAHWWAASEPMQGLPSRHTPVQCMSEVECALCVAGWQDGDAPIWSRHHFGPLNYLWRELVGHLGMEHGVRPVPADCPDGMWTGGDPA